MSTTTGHSDSPDHRAGDPRPAGHADQDVLPLPRPASATEPNSHVCPVCLGMPGVLPVMNRQAVEYSIRTGLALGCQIARLHQVGPQELLLPRPAQELPDQPVRPAAVRRRRLRRAHRQDGATQPRPHPPRPPRGGRRQEPPRAARHHTSVDLNRAGTPLLEIVTEPDLASAEEALRLLRRAAAAGPLPGRQRGQHADGPHALRAEHQRAHHRTTAASTARPSCEVKNLNSFRAVRDAIAYEIERQVDDWLANRDYVARARPPRRTAAGTTSAASPSSSGARKRPTTTATSPTRTWCRWWWTRRG